MCGFVPTVFDGLVDPDPYSECRSGFRFLKKEKNVNSAKHYFLRTGTVHLYIPSE